MHALKFNGSLRYPFYDHLENPFLYKIYLSRFIFQVQNLPGGLKELHLFDEDARRWLGLMGGGGDPISSQWFGMGSIISPISVVGFYLALVFTVHQKMKQHPVTIKPVLVIYNLLQVKIYSI